MKYRVVGVTVCVVLASLFQLLHAISARVCVSERLNIWEFCTSCCWYLCLFSLPYCRLIIFTGIFSCFTLDPCLVVHIREYAFANALHVCECVWWTLFFGVASMKKFQYQMNLRPYERRTKIMVWMCVPVSLHTSTHTYANKYIHTNIILIYLNDCTFVIKYPIEQQKRQIE